MDIVGTFNHLIPSDQLEDSLLLGQNLECEASDEFASSHNFTEESLKNMLSDKDPMFGSAYTQFHLLENDDANFQLPGSLAPDHDMNAPDFNQTPADGDETQSRFSRGRRKSGSQPQRKQTASRGRGRGGRRGGPFRGVSSLRLWEKSNETTTEEQASTSLALPYSEEREALLSRRFSAQEVEPSMNPVVVLRRLTVTVGGFKIELLPGPSTFQAFNLPEESVVSDCNGLILEENQAFEEHQAPEVVQELEVIEQEVVDVPMDFGPCVNPNDVQHTNGAAEATVEVTVEAKEDDQNAVEKISVSKPLKKKIKPDKSLAGKPEKPKQPPSVIKSKPGHGNPPDGQQSAQGSKHPKVHDKKLQKASVDKHHLKSKPVSSGPKQATVSPGPKPSADPQKVHTSPSVKPNAQSSVPDSATVHRKSSSDAGKPVLNKHPQTVKKAPGQAPIQGKPSQVAKDSSTEDEQEKSKVKKQDKLLQRQRSRSSRSISIEEPELFVPDNAPVVKKASLEDDHPAAAENETVWDSTQQCTLCSKPHSNRFMVGCGHCDDWFHGDCVGLDLAKVKQMEKDDQEYVCLKCCADEDGKNNNEHPDAPEKSTSTQKPGPEPAVTAGGIRPFRKDSGDRRPSTDSAQKSESTKHERKKAKISIPSSKKPSTGQIRRSVRDSLEDILVKRLKGSDLKISNEKAAEVAKATEKELFALFQSVESKYKNKYRSLMFNLKDTKNNVLFKRVLRGEVSPRHLVRMSAEELASKELAAWRQRENRHTIEMIEKEQREVDRRPVTKITHKGEIEIENQEPAKVPEAMTDYSPKAAEVPEEKISEAKPESPEKTKDTTSLHKSHLFDLHCKICTGRMAPPVEEANTKVVKVATTVSRRQSTATDGDSQEAKSISPTVAPSALVDDLSLRAMEEGLLNFPGYESRLESVSSKEDTAAFLAGLTSFWNGFVDMPAVARYLTKAYPVSGTLDHLTEDLPESIQVGGRISPYTVWDYVEKIRASGTKEICVIRFTPDTEEDEISYTLLYAYFSSRRRYGVVANNRKQVKDMYLIPLGSSEKIPHQIVPFDGPGLEINRPNLLLGLIIRQRPKRDFGVILPSDVSEPPSFLMESKPEVDPVPEVAVTQTEDQDFISTLGRTNKNDSANLDNSSAEKSLLEPENDKNVFLRFLPGVLTQPKSDAAVPDDKVQNTDNGTTGQTSTSEVANSGSLTPKTPTTSRLDRFIIKKKEPKPVQTQEAPSSIPEPCSEEKPKAGETLRGLVLSLKDKPGDVSTEAFLSSISTPQSEIEPNTVEAKSDVIAPSTQTTQEVDAVTLPADAQNAEKHPSEVLDLEISAETLVDTPIEELPTGTSPLEPKEVEEQPLNTTSTEPEASPSVSSESTTVLQSPPEQPPTEFKVVEDIQNITTIFSLGKNDGPKPLRPRLQNPKPFNAHGPPPTSFASYHTGPPEHRYHPVPVPPFPPQTNPIPFMSLHQQVPPPFGYHPAPPPPMIFAQNDPHRMHPLPWSQPVPPQVCFPQMPETRLVPQASYMGSRFSDSAPQKSKNCTEMWDRRKDDLDYHGRHRTKSEHHERERHKSRSRSRSRSRHRHKSRHSRDDRHKEKRKERRHSSHHRDKDGDRNKHRRDSDYEKHRRDSDHEKHRRDSDHEKHRRDSKDRHS